MATATNKYLLGGNMKLLRENEPLLGGNKNLVVEFLLKGEFFLVGAWVNFRASGRTPTIFLVEKTLVDKYFLH